MRDGCLPTTIVATLIVVFAALLFGAPIIGASGLSWDNSATVARVNARHAEEMARIANANKDGERWNQTLTLIIVAGTVVGIVVTVGHTLRHNADKRAEVQLAALPYLAQRPGSRLEVVDGVWCVIDDRRKEVLKLPKLGG